MKVEIAGYERMVRWLFPPGPESTREYERCAEAVPEAFGLSASTVSRRFIRASARKLQELSDRRRGSGLEARDVRFLTMHPLYDTVIQMEEVLTIRVPKGTRRRLERRARAEKLTLSQYIRRALDTEALLGAFEAARADLVPIARAKGIYTDEEVFRIVS